MIGFWGRLYVPTVETRKSWYQVNPEIDYVVKKNNIVTGYTTILPLKPEIMRHLMDGEIGTKDIAPSDIMPFSPDTPLECWIAIAVKPGVYMPEKYAVRLIGGTIKALKQLGEKGIIIKKLWAKSETPDGIKLAQSLGLEEIDATSNNMPRKFMLDVDTSDSPFLKEYKQALKEARR